MSQSDENMHADCIQCKMSIQVEGGETVQLGQTFTFKTPLTVNEKGYKRQLAPDVLALLNKAYCQYRLAVRMADGFIDPQKVPPVTVTAVRDSQGQEWSASITVGYNVYKYKNW